MKERYPERLVWTNKGEGMERHLGRDRRPGCVGLQASGHGLHSERDGELLEGLSRGETQSDVCY